MNIEQLNARIKALAGKITGKHPRVSVVISDYGTYGVFADSIGHGDIFKGHGRDLDALLDECEAAIDAAHPDVLARTLGVEVAA
jgi:hypothetical protein